MPTRPKTKRTTRRMPSILRERRKRKGLIFFRKNNQKGFSRASNGFIASHKTRDLPFHGSISQYNLLKGKIAAKFIERNKKAPRIYILRVYDGINTQDILSRKVYVVRVDRQDYSEYFLIKDREVLKVLHHLTRK